MNASASCMWCNTPFDTIGQPMCSCAIMRAAHDVDRRMTADRLLDQRLSTLEQRVANLEGRQWHASPVVTAAPNPQPVPLSVALQELTCRVHHSEDE